MIDTLHEYRWIILVADILAWVWLFWAMNRGQTLPDSALTPGTPAKSQLGANRKPGDIVPLHRTTTGPLAPSIEAGMAEHHLRSAAATAKLQPIADAKAKPTESLKTIPPPPPTPEQLKLAEQKLPSGQPRPTTADGDDAMDSMFSGLKPAGEPGQKSGTGVIRKANRLEELGFHHEIKSDRLPTQPSEPPKPRSQTAELDDILKRIDQVLADNPAPAATAAPAAQTVPPAPSAIAGAMPPVAPSLAPSTATPPPAAPATPKQTPSWARADIQDEDLDPAEQRNAKTEDLSAQQTPVPKKDDSTAGDGKKPDDTQQKLF